MPQNNKLKAFTRLDSSGRIVPGSTVLRTKMPVTGRWISMEAYACCFPSITIESTPGDVSVDDIVLSILCDDVEVLNIVSGSTSTTIDEMVAALNTNFGYLGTFSTDGTSITLLLKLDIAQSLCPDGDLTMDITGTNITTTTTTTTTSTTTTSP